MEIIFSIENPETSPLQLAIGEAVTALATGNARPDVYETPMDDQTQKVSLKNLFKFFKNIIFIETCTIF